MPEPDGTDRPGEPPAPTPSNRSGSLDETIAEGLPGFAHRDLEPGTMLGNHRILGVLATGDSVEVLSRTGAWTQVRAPGGTDGWIPEGYLQAETPARILLERHQAETAELRTRFENLSAEVVDLRERNPQLSEQESKQRSEIDLLTRENLELRAGARGPEWITGASILFVGAILGIIVHRSASRRPSPRIRL